MRTPTVWFWSFVTQFYMKIFKPVVTFRLPSVLPLSMLSLEEVSKFDLLVITATVIVIYNHYNLKLPVFNNSKLSSDTIIIVQDGSDSIDISLCRV